MINMNALKEEARLLLNEVNIHGGCSVNRNAKRTGYSGEYVFEGLSFRDRIKQLKQRIQQLEKSV